MWAVALPGSALISDSDINCVSRMNRWQLDRTFELKAIALNQYNIWHILNVHQYVKPKDDDNFCLINVLLFTSVKNLTDKVFKIAVWRLAVSHSLSWWNFTTMWINNVWWMQRGRQPLKNWEVTVRFFSRFLWCCLTFYQPVLDKWYTAAKQRTNSAWRRGMSGRLHPGCGTGPNKSLEMVP